MSESNLHKHFRDDGNVPIPIPPADDSWRLMEQRLNEVMPVTQQVGGHATPNSSGIIAKMLPAVKYAVAAIFVSGVVLYSLHRINRPVPVPAPAAQDGPFTTKDSAALTTDTMADQSNIITIPDTNDTTSPINAGAEGNITPVNASDKPLGNTSGSTAEEKTGHPSATNAIAATVGTPATQTITDANVGHTIHPSATGTAAAKPSATGKTAAVASVNRKIPHNANTTNAAGDKQMISHDQPTHRTPAGKTTKTTNQQKTLLKSGQQTSDGVHTSLPADSPDENNVAVVGREDHNLTEKAAMLEPGLPARLTLQQLPLYKASQSLKVSRETMDRLASYRMPRSRSYTPGYWQLMAQWTVPVPAVSNPGYYKGPDGNTQLYRLLIPGVRMQRTWNNAALSLDFNAMSTQPYRNEPYYYTNNLAGADWMTRTILQTFGYSASLAYHHRIAGNFFGSAGVQAYYGHTASILEVARSHDTTGVHTKTTTSGEKDKVWNSINKFQGRITGEIYYDHARWQAALRTAVPVQQPAKDSMGMGMKPVVQLELLLRWKINRRK